MSKKLFLIEAPGKLKKLRQILGAEYIVKASGGHIRELARDGEDNLGFDLNEHSICCRFVPRNSQAKKTIAELKELARKVNTVILATDSVLDKLVGFRGSPLVWKLENGAKSIGRVQSAALHILCQREREIQQFKPQDYWLVSVTYAEGFKAYYLGESVPKSASKDNNNERDDTKEKEEKQAEATKVGSPVSMVISKSYDTDLVGVWHCQTPTIMYHRRTFYTMMSGEPLFPQMS